MKNIRFLLPAFVMITLASPAFSQKYKKASDTARLKKEYVEVSNEIAELTSKLTIAQNDLPGYHAKANDATTEAQKSADESKRAATNGEVDDAKHAKKKAGEALNKAEDAKDASKRTKKQEKEIAKLEDKLKGKQKRLQELEEMRLAIKKEADAKW